MYEELLRQSPSDPAIVMRMVGASVQHARILDQLGDSRQAGETIQLGTELLEDASVNVQIPEDERHIWLAKLANEKGNYINHGFRSQDADACFKRALLFAQKLPESDPNAQVEIIRARVGLGNNRAKGRRGPRESDSQRKERRLSLEKAIGMLDQLRSQHVNEAGEPLPGLSLGTAGIEVLRAQSYLGLAALAEDGDERTQQTYKAVEILEAYLKDHANSSFVRMELVRALSNGAGDPNGPVRKPGPGNRSTDKARPRDRKSIKPQLEKALKVLRPLREDFPSNSSFVLEEVRIRYRLALMNKRRGRLDDAKRQLELAIELETVLVETLPDNVAHRCWRALLNHSLAEVLRDSSQPRAAEAAIKNARQDLAAVSEEHSDHPMVERVERTLSERIPSPR